MPAAEQSLPIPRPTAFLASSVGRKLVMAVTGMALVGFVAMHTLGNMQAYLGAEPMNKYAELLQGMIHGMGIWVFRGVMGAAVALHVWAAASLTLDNWKARPKGYRAQAYQAASWSSLTMRWTGAFLAAFVVYHLLHLTTGQAHPAFVKGDAYANFVHGFQSVPASLFYIAAQLCLGLHLWHGVWSFTQTLGLAHPRYDRLRRVLAAGVTLWVAGGNISFPIAVLTGVIHL
jgi:succinate dehydrogenase / fumarate reductase cytochrome b subunit